jgi:hypothetical protein
MGAQCPDKSVCSTQSVAETCLFSKKENIPIFLQVVIKMINKKIVARKSLATKQCPEYLG